MCTHIYAIYTFKSITYTHINIHILRAHTWIYVYKLHMYICVYIHMNTETYMEKKSTNFAKEK